MERSRPAWAVFGLCLFIPAGAGAQTAPDNLWISGYLASGTQKSGAGGKFDVDDVDFDAITHLIHFGLTPQPDGSVRCNTLSAERRRSAVATAHAHGRPILLCVGGRDTHGSFAAAIQPAVRPVFIANLVRAMAADGYDGLDLDMEPIQTADVPDYEAFIVDLHDALRGRATPLLSRPLLTTAVNWQTEMFGRPQDRCGPIHLRPGVGAAFYGYAGSDGDGVSTGGATRPMPSWTVAPSMTALPFDTIRGTYSRSDFYRCDAGAAAPVASIFASTSSVTGNTTSPEQNAWCSTKHRVVFYDACTLEKTRPNVEHGIFLPIKPLTVKISRGWTVEFGGLIDVPEGRRQ